ncbi:hypothetical protein M9435_006279 [Picochlorum sp. BPE23]|nr:hypothetical protein M9435_006279 [Picochlorum sp. BPE23]
MWGAQSQGIDDIVRRISQNDASLTSLYLMRHRRFNEEDAGRLADALSRSETLVELNLSSHAISPRVAGILGAGLKSNQSIRFISIGNSTFGDEAMVELCGCFEENTSITTIDLERKGLTRSSAAAVCRAVEKSTSVKHLMLSHNDLQGGLEDVLPCVSGLESFVSHSCGIGCARSSTALSVAMRNASALKRLELDHNMLDASSAVLLAEGISHCTCLEKISLSSNPLGPEGVSSLVEALPAGIQSIDISHTDAQDAGICSLAACLRSQKLPHIRYINISGCGLTARSMSTLLEAASHLPDGKGLELDAGENIGLGHDEFFSYVLTCHRILSLRLHGCNLGTRGIESLIRALEVHAGGAHPLRDLDISGNNIPEDCMVTLLSRLASPHGISVFSCLQTLVIAANPDVEGHKVADAVEALYTARPSMVVIRAATDSSGQK